MDSFRIGDVTIERVLPKTSEADSANADASASGSTPSNSGDPATATTTKEDGLLTNGSPKENTFTEPSGDASSGLTPSVETKEEKAEGQPDPHLDPGPNKMDVDDIDVNVEPAFNDGSGKVVKAEPEDDEDLEDDENDDYLPEDDQDDHMSAQSGDDGDAREDEDDEDDEDDDEAGDGDEEDEDETLRELAEAVSRGEVEGEEAEGDADPGQEVKKKVIKRRKKRKIGSEEGGEGSDGEKKKRKKVRKKKKGTGKGKDEEKEGSSEEASGSEEEGGEKKKKKGKKGKKGKKKTDDGDDDSGDKAGERKAANLRRNIREVMDETQLDEATLAAQRQEMERLRRVQEQQRLIREYQRQMAQTRQNSKTEQRVLSLLQGNTSILKQVAGSGPPQSSSSGSRSPSTVLVKLAAGQTPQTGKKVVEVLRVPKGTTAVPAKPGTVLKPSVTRTLVTKPRALTGAHMMTPSVSIAPVRSASGIKPVVPLKSPLVKMPPFSGSEGEEDEDEEEEMPELEEGETKVPRKGKDVVTISSSSSSEDCIVLSEPSDDGEDEQEEDPTNSGMHTNDLFNVPDEEGRVQVNMGKPEGDPDIFLAPHIARIIKPHQVGGIRFLYDNVVESIERFNTSPGFGCILAHSMGLGKTLQVISFCDIFLRHTPAKTVLCIMPINTLQNWMAEFNMWLPKDATSSPLAAHGEVRPRSFSIHVLNDSHKTLKARARVVDDWQREGGVLLIGYELYRLLSLKRPSKPKKSRRKKPVEEEEPLDPEEEEKKEKEMLEAVHGALVKPGPDLVICDEGHRIKNSHASISMALKQIRSKRRVVLTGYPLQNNLLEYWCMVDFVRPNYLGTKTEFCNMFERPIQNGQCIDSTPQDIRLMRYRAHVLHSLLEGFVQRRSHSVLQNSLPQKEEYVLLVRMTDFQRKLYDTFMNEVVRTKAVPNPLKAFAVCCKIWNHPDVLYQFLRKREGGEGVDLDLEEAAASLAPTTVEATEEGGVPGAGAAAPGVPPAPVGRRPAKGRARATGGGKGRKKGGAAANKPAAAVIPNTSSQTDSSNVFSSSSGSNYPPMHGQVNQNMMSPYGSYPPPPAQQGHSQYQPPFGSMSHHYPDSNSSYGGYSSSGFSGSSMPMSGQGNFPNANVGYGESVGSQPGSFGSSPQSMFPTSNTPSSAASSSQGYDSMASPYFSGSNNSSGQHAMGDNFQPSGGYGQSWSGGSNYNFNQSQQGSQSFSGQNYNQGGSFQGYNAPPASGQGFSQNMYNPPPGSSSSTAATGSGSANGGSSGGNGSTAPSTSSGYQQQGMMGQPPNQQNNQQMMMGNQGMMHGQQRMMIPPSPVNSSGMLPGGSPSNDAMMSGQPRSRRSIPPFVQESPCNASGMLPGGAPTKDLMMPGKNPGMLPGMGGNMAPRMLGNMNDRMMPMDAGMGGLGPGMGPDGMMQHHSQDMGIYSSQNMMNNQPLPSMGGAEAPSAEDLLRSESEDFTPFDGSVDMMGMNKKPDMQGGMYGMKSENSRMFDPWANSHNQGYSMGNSYKHEDMKMENSYSDMKAGITKMKNDRDDKYPMDSMSLTELKSDMGDSKTKEAMDPGSLKGMEQDERKWQVDSMEMVDKDKDKEGEVKGKEDGKEDEEDESVVGPDGKPAIEVTGPGKAVVNNKEDPGIPYDWAVELMKDYVPGLIENSAKMAIFFCILEESLALGDRILVFSQSLFTLSLIEEFLQRNYIPLPGVYERWQRNRSYYRLDGSTAALEREKLINEFNQNPGVHMFLVSTRAGSLGINLVGANRVIVFDASWNPCHDTQAVCRVYRYGQKKPCFVYRLVMDNCLEKKIYDRQINKQGMSDRVVDECNPDAHLSIKEVTNLCWDDEKETEIEDFSKDKDNYADLVMQKVLEKHGKSLSKPPFHHESLLVDRKDKKLSQAEKRLAKRSYEMEKRANNKPVYHYYNSGAPGGLQISRAVQRDGTIVKPIASVRPMQAELPLERGPGGIIRQGAHPGRTKWIPADVWQRQGMTAQEMTLPLDVVIPTNSPDRTSIVLKAGQRVMVLKSPKGIYMQLESGKIIAIRTAFKMGGNKGDGKGPVDKDDIKKGILGKSGAKLPSGIHPLRNNPNITITPRGSPGAARGIRPNVLQTRAVPTRLTSPIGRGGWHARPGLAGRGVTVRPSAPGLRPGLRPISPSVTVTPSLSRTASASVTISPKTGGLTSKGVEDSTEASSLPGSQADSLGGSQAGSLAGSRPTSQAGSDDGQNSNSSQDMSNHAKRIPPPHETDDLGEVPDKAWLDDDEDGPSAMGKTHEDEGSQNYLDAALSSHSQSSTFTTGSDYTEALPTSKSAADAGRPDRTREPEDSDRNLDADRGTPPVSEDLTKSKSFRHSSRQNSNSSAEVDSKNRDFGGFSQNQPVNFAGGFANAPPKPYSGSSFDSGPMMSSYRGSGPQDAEEEEKARPRKSPAASRGRKLSQYLESEASASIDSSNQWKSPQQFSPGMASKPPQQRSLESPAYDDNSNASATSNISAKSSSTTATTASVPSERLQPPPEDHHMSGYFNSSQQKNSNQQASSTLTKTPVTSSSTLSNPPTPTPPTSSSSNFSLPPSTAPAPAPVMDPYLYGGYGSYPPPPSSYYNPYAHPMTAPPLHQQPYAPGFFPDRNAPAAPTIPAPPTSTAAPAPVPTIPAVPAAAPPAAPPPAPVKPEAADPVRHQSNSSKSSTSTESMKKGSRTRSDVPVPSAYDGRSAAASSSASTTSSRSPSSTPVSSVDPTVYSASSTTTNPYNPMMMSPSYNTSSQYPPPPPAINSSAPPPANSPNLFSAAAAANYPPSPYATPYAYPGSNQFESDFARASMYSAFHRPDPGQFPAPGPLDPSSPYLPPLPAHTRPMNPGYPPQNMYPAQYGSARDPYGQLPPYPANPFMMPPTPYGSLPVAPSSAPSASNPDQPQSQ